MLETLWYKKTEVVRFCFCWTLLVVCCDGLVLTPRLTAQCLTAIGEWQRNDAVNRRIATPSFKKPYSLLQRERLWVPKRLWYISEAKHAANTFKRDVQKLNEDGVQMDGTTG